MVQTLGLAEDSENSPSELGFHFIHFKATEHASLGIESLLEQVDLLSAQPRASTQPKITA